MYAIWNVTAGHWVTSPDMPMTWKEGKKWLKWNKKKIKELSHMGVVPDTYQIREVGE